MNTFCSNSNSSCRRVGPIRAGTRDMHTRVLCARTKKNEEPKAQGKRTWYSSGVSDQRFSFRLASAMGSRGRAEAHNRARTRHRLLRALPHRRHETHECHCLPLLLLRMTTIACCFFFFKLHENNYGMVQCVPCDSSLFH